MDVPANPGSVMEFYCRDPGGVNLFLFPDTYIFTFCSSRKHRSAYDLKSVHETPATSSMARPPSGSKSTRSASSRTGLLSASRQAVAGRQHTVTQQTVSVARRRERPTNPSPFRAHRVTMARSLLVRYEHVRIAPLHLYRSAHVEPRIACGLAIAK